MEKKNNSIPKEIKLNLLKKYILSTFMLAIYGIQIGHTIYNRINWPFCSHNFYYQRTPFVKELFKIILYDDQNNHIIVDPKHVLPIEGYRCGAIFKSVFIQNGNFAKKRKFAKLILERLNSGGWKAFDEKFYAVKPSNGNKFISLTVEKHWVDISQYSTMQKLIVVKRETLFELESKEINEER